MVAGIVADTHLTDRWGRRLPASCVDRLRQVDLVLHAGDFNVERALAELEQLGPPVAAVHGNLDCPRLRSRLPAERMVSLGGARIGLVHDAGPARGRLGRLRRRFPQADAVVFGHSHVPLNERHGAFQIFNPGSPTLRRRQPRHTMGIAYAERDTITFKHVALD